MTATCQHTGLAFEARSRAAKNHPAISELLAEAHKRGAYQAVLEVLQEMKAAGERDLAQIETAARLAIDGRRAELQIKRDEWRARRAEYVASIGRGTHPDNISNAELMSETPRGSGVDSEPVDF